MVISLLCLTDIKNWLVQSKRLLLASPKQTALALVIPEQTATGKETSNPFMAVARDSSRMFLSQRKYATEILERAHMLNCNPLQQVCLYMHDHREPHLSTLKRILRYVRGILDHGLQLFSSSTTSLVAYSDVN
ncbi:ribonuclease H-like domain-containing protein [Tanacetum coccineum]